MQKMRDVHDVGLIKRVESVTPMVACHRSQKFTCGLTDAVRGTRTDLWSALMDRPRVDGSFVAGIEAQFGERDRFSVGPK